MTVQGEAVLARSHIRLGLDSVTQAEAVDAAGQHLVELGKATADYIPAMHQREEAFATYMGNGVAMPHGTFEAKEAITGTGIVVHQYPAGIEWSGSDEPTYLVVGLAADSDSHVDLLSQLAEVLQDEELCEQLWTTTDPQFVLDTLQESPE